MSSPHVFIDSEANEIHRHRGIQLWRQVDGQRRRSGAPIFQQQRVVDGVTIEARSTANPAGNRVRIYGDVYAYTLIAFYDYNTTQTFWNYNGFLGHQKFALTDPYAPLGTVEASGPNNSFPIVCFPVPDVHNGTVMAIAANIEKNRPSVDDYIKYEMWVDDSTVAVGALISDDGSPNYFGVGWIGSWVISSRTYDTSEILGWNSAVLTGFEAGGLIGNVIIDNKLYTIWYETTSSGYHYYLLGFNTAGELIEDYKLTSISGIYMYPQMIYTYFTSSGTKIYMMSEENKTLYVFDIEAGVGVTETTYTAIDTDRIAGVCATGAYIYYWTLTAVGSTWNWKVYRSPIAEPFSWTLILTTTTALPWATFNRTTFNIAVSNDDTKLFMAYIESFNGLLSGLLGRMRQYDLTVLPSAPVLDLQLFTQPDKYIIGLKYR